MGISSTSGTWTKATISRTPQVNFRVFCLFNYHLLSELTQRKQQLVLPFSSSWKSLPVEQHHHPQHVPAVPAHPGGPGWAQDTQQQSPPRSARAWNKSSTSSLTATLSWKAAIPQRQWELLAVSAPGRGKGGEPDVPAAPRLPVLRSCLTSAAPGCPRHAPSLKQDN